jgi:chromosome segregation ATPase
VWEARDEAVPEPRPGQAEARASLKVAGVVAVPLFRAVEVRRFLSPERVRPLQAALTESGLLDALVVRAEHAETAERALGAEGGDRWIRPSPHPQGAATLADVLEPAPCDVPEADVIAALRSVALQTDGHGGSAVVAADGCWRLGVLEGRAAPVGEDAPVYLGREARVRERDRRVAHLRNAIQELGERREAAREEIRLLDERLRGLDADLDTLRGLPEIVALSGALTVRAERSLQVQRGSERLHEAEARTADLRRAVGAARQLHEETVRREPSARGRSADGVRELISAGERVVTLAERVSDRLATLRARGEELVRIEAVMAQARVSFDNAQAREGEAAEAVAECEGRVRTIETDLRELGLDEIMDEVRRAEEREEELVATGRELVATISALKVSLESTEARIGDLEPERARCEGERGEARTRLGHAVRAYPTLQEAATLFGEGTEGAAVRAADHLLGRREERATDLRRRIQDDRTRAFQALSQEVTEARSPLIDYHPSLDSETGEVSFRHEGRELPPHALLEILERHRTRQMSVMREKEDELYEEFFLQEVSGRIREAIERAEESVERVNALLAERPLANDEILSLRWRPLREIGADGADHPRLVELLKKPASVLPPDDVRWIKSFFRDRVRMVREDAVRGAESGFDEEASFSEALRAVLDYRRWFSFTIHGKRPGEAVTEITNREFASRSGGEKSLTMFVPLLAAVDARFRSARPDAPKLVGLDEAFAGVDSDNINQMYAFMVSLDLSWIMTSEKLWGVGAALPACTTYQFHRQGTVAAVRPWLWDGRRNLDEPTLIVAEGSRDDTEEEGSIVA